jgi:hypothetical protein
MDCTRAEDRLERLEEVAVLECCCAGLLLSWIDAVGLMLLD